MSRKRRHSESYHRCSECYANDHNSNECTFSKLTSCLSCFRLNISITACNCIDRTLPTPPQGLRLVGTHEAPRWVVDITIHDRLFAALINPTLERGRVNPSIARWLHAIPQKGTKVTKDTVTFRFTRNQRTYQITCDISKHLEDDIHIGADLMKFLGYTFVMEDVSINSKDSHIAPTPFEADYVYNIKGKGQYLRNYLQDQAFFLKMKRDIKEDYGIPTNFQSTENQRVVRIFRTLSVSSDATTELNSDYDVEQPHQQCSSSS